MRDKDLKSKNFVEEKKVYILGEFDETIAKYVVPEFVKLTEDRNNKSIDIYINSNGGYTSYLKQLLGIVEKFKADGGVIKTFVYGNAYSCGSILACSGTKGERYIYEYSEHCCHLGAATTGYVINDVELERMSDRVKRHFDFVRNCYKKYAKVKNLEEVIKNDCYFIEGKKIIENGLADKII